MKGDQRNIYPGGNTPRGFYSYYNYILPQRKAEKIYWAASSFCRILICRAIRLKSVFFTASV